ncbi:MAG: nucleotide exchange factor GrpE [Desulfovibrio sp.]
MAEEKKDTVTEETETAEVQDENIQEEAEEAQVSLSEEELVALCREHVCPGCDVMQEAEQLKLRALADVENVKKRLSRETDELRKYAGESILADLLPVLDNLDLALLHSAGLDSCKDFVMGVDMTRKIFLETLSKHGLTAVGKVGEEFDPQFHEAVGMAQEADKEDNCIAQMVQTGYLLKGRLLRPAKVMVNKLS